MTPHRTRHTCMHTFTSGYQLVTRPCMVHLPPPPSLRSSLPSLGSAPRSSPSPLRAALPVCHSVYLCARPSALLPPGTSTSHPSRSVMPCYLKGILHSTISHSLSHADPAGSAADSRPDSGTGSRLFEVNIWMRHYGREYPERSQWRMQRRCC